MENKDPDRRTKGYILMRAILDFGMGVLILCLGIFFLVAPSLGIGFEIDNFYRYFFSALCIVYGSWRVYRGYKKNYFR
jgi:hypothetical protein